MEFEELALANFNEVHRLVKATKVLVFIFQSDLLLMLLEGLVHIINAIITVSLLPNPPRNLQFCAKVYTNFVDFFWHKVSNK